MAALHGKANQSRTLWWNSSCTLNCMRSFVIGLQSFLNTTTKLASHWKHDTGVLKVYKTPSPVPKNSETESKHSTGKPPRIRLRITKRWCQGPPGWSCCGLPHLQAIEAMIAGIFSYYNYYNSVKYLMSNSPVVHDSSAIAKHKITNSNLRNSTSNFNQVQQTIINIRINMFI